MNSFGESVKACAFEPRNSASTTLSLPITIGKSLLPGVPIASSGDKVFTKTATGEPGRLCLSTTFLNLILTSSKMAMSLCRDKLPPVKDIFRKVYLLIRHSIFEYTKNSIYLKKFTANIFINDRMYLRQFQVFLSGIVLQPPLGLRSVHL
ncbi:MAG: hypothetical protein ILNGONEN_02253 [Syntrophorhabdaceae bacterium]|nr:hypothetical protein [Syntrophorhabdaceae bacterium]